jgi:hypothetical protein
VINQDYNQYGLMALPGMRFNINIKLSFSSSTNVQFYYKMLATTGISISDTGTKTAISNTQVILYESSTTPETLYGLS